MTIHIPKGWLAVVVAALLALLALAGLRRGAPSSPSRSRTRADPGSHLGNGAVVGEMPDGFSNWAMKCDGRGHRVYTTYHGDRAYGAITVVRDTACGPDIP